MIPICWTPCATTVAEPWQEVPHWWKGRPWGRAGVLWLEPHVCTELGSPNPADNPCCLKKISASPGHAWCCPSSLAPTCHEFSFILCAPLSKTGTVDKMLLLLPLLISSSSFNSSLETSSTLVAGIILAFPQRVQLPLLFTGISLGLKLSFSWDIESHVPHIIPPSISLLLLESRQKRKKTTCIPLFPQKVHSIPLRTDATNTSNRRKK